MCCNLLSSLTLSYPLIMFQDFWTWLYVQCTNVLLLPEHIGSGIMPPKSNVTLIFLVSFQFKQYPQLLPLSSHLAPLQVQLVSTTPEPSITP